MSQKNCFHRKLNPWSRIQCYNTLCTLRWYEPTTSTPSWDFLYSKYRINVCCWSSYLFLVCNSASFVDLYEIRLTRVSLSKYTFLTTYNICNHFFAFIFLVFAKRHFFLPSASMIRYDCLQENSSLVEKVVFLYTWVYIRSTSGIS